MYKEFSLQEQASAGPGSIKETSSYTNLLRVDTVEENTGLQAGKTKSKIDTVARDKVALRDRVASARVLE